MKITLADGKEYELNVDEAIKNKVLTPLPGIKQFSVGDVFSSPLHAQIVIVQPIYMNTSTMGYNAAVYGFIGNRGDFHPYSNTTELFTYEEVLEYLNNNNLSYKGNVTGALYSALKAMVGDEFCG